MTANRPIGVFDSGVGGLTVLKALRDRMPSEALLYLGDTARLPYGTKSARAVNAYALEAARALVDAGIKALVVADNTSSAHALDSLRNVFPGLPVVGVVEPGAAAAAHASATGRIVVIATESTVQAETYPPAIRATRPDATVIQQACPLFVALAEEGMVDGPIAEQVARHYLAPLFADRPPAERGDCLLLGCTHFPVFAPLLRRLLGPEVAIVDSATTTARAVESLLDALALAAPRRDAPAPLRYLATDSPDRFAQVSKVFVSWRIAAAEVERMDLASAAFSGNIEPVPLPSVG
ncbi:MAG: glutamate racemase [Magnetospirillum sp.]|nr:glutamate racemase [Magnetospirillum sp.]